MTRGASRPRPSGRTGTGCSPSSSAWNSWGGALRAEASPGAGCRVTLVAPGEGRAAPGTVPLPAQSPGAGTESAESVVSTPPSRTIRVLIADDHRVVREGLAGLLRMHAGIDVVGQAENGRAAVELARSLTPDAVVMDVSMPIMGGIDATRSILSERPRIRVVGLSMHERTDMAEAMLGAGAVAYLSKGGPPQALVEAIRG